MVSERIEKTPAGTIVRYQNRNLTSTDYIGRSMKDLSISSHDTAIHFISKPDGTIGRYKLQNWIMMKESALLDLQMGRYIG